MFNVKFILYRVLKYINYINKREFKVQYLCVKLMYIDI